MTPPLSPGNSEEGNSIMVDSEPRYSGPGHMPVDRQSPSAWREDTAMRSHTPPRPPQRLLEDEQVHVERSGLLRLRDFEIKGTLGLFFDDLRDWSPGTETGF